MQTLEKRRIITIGQLSKFLAENGFVDNQKDLIISTKYNKVTIISNITNKVLFHSSELEGIGLGDLYIEIMKDKQLQKWGSYLYSYTYILD